MKPEAIYESWVPIDSEWSLWARPILFAQMSELSTEQPCGADWLTIDVSWAPGADEKVVLIVDLPGAASVVTGLALAGQGFRPVPLFNACTGSCEVVDQSLIIGALRAGAGYLASLALADAPPAFLLDSRRMSPDQVRPGDFDNRWQVFPQDFPSAAFLTQRGYIRALLIQGERKEHADELSHAVRLGRPQDINIVGKRPAQDLAHILRRWQDAGITIQAKDLANAAPPAPITVDRPALYRSAWQRVLAIFGLRQNPQGGFGGLEPYPSHG